MDEYLTHGTINGVNADLLLNTTSKEDIILREFWNENQQDPTCNSQHVCNGDCIFWSTRTHRQEGWYVCTASHRIHVCSPRCDQYEYEGRSYCRLTHHDFGHVFVQTTGCYDAEPHWQMVKRKNTRSGTNDNDNVPEKAKKIVYDAFVSEERRCKQQTERLSVDKELQKIVNSLKGPPTITAINAIWRKLTRKTHLCNYKIPDRLDENIRRVTFKVTKYINNLPERLPFKHKSLLDNKAILIKAILFAMRSGVTRDGVTFIPRDTWVSQHLPPHSKLYGGRSQTITKTIRQLTQPMCEAMENRADPIEYDYLIMK